MQQVQQVLRDGKAGKASKGAQADKRGAGDPLTAFERRMVQPIGAPGWQFRVRALGGKNERDHECLAKRTMQVCQKGMMAAFWAPGADE